jgi:hypothetical protein
MQYQPAEVKNGPRDEFCLYGTTKIFFVAGSLTLLPGG